MRLFSKKNLKIIFFSILVVVGGYIGFDQYCRYMLCFSARPVPSSVPPARAARFAIPSGLSVNQGKTLPPLETIPLQNQSIARMEFFSVLPPEVLKAMAERIQEEPEYMERLALVDDFLFRRTGVNEVDPESRKSEDGVNYIGDARKLAFLEKLTGKPFRGTHTGKDVTTAPHIMSAPILLADYNKMQLLREAFFLLHTRPSMEFYEELSGPDGQVRETIRRFYENYGRLETILWLEDMSKAFNPPVELEEKIRRLADVAPGIDMRKFGKMVTYGTSGQDFLSASGTGGEVFFPLDYNDTVTGSEGDDVYLYRLYDGFDTIIEKGGKDAVYFDGRIQPEDIRLDVEGTDVFLTFKSDLRQGIRIRNFICDPDSRIETLRFTKNRQVNLPAAVDEIIRQNEELRLQTEETRRTHCLKQDAE